MSEGTSDRSRLIWQLIFVLILCAGVAFLIFFLIRSRSPEGAHRVEFRVEASGGYANITLEAGKAASIPQPTTVTVPWSKTLRIAPGTEVYLTAANPTETGKVTCTILLDKTVWKTDTTNAPKNGVACAGIVP